MTSDARTCTVDMDACRCGEGREWHDHVPEHAYAGFCGETLVDDEKSPCAAKDVRGGLCGRKASSLYHEPDGGTGRAYHPYIPSAKKCPVHGAAR